MDAELLRGNLDMLLLAALARGPGHGYALIDELRRRSGGALDLAEGTVYPALHRLERSGLLTSEWRTAGGRKRRVYALSSAGREALRAREREWRGFSRVVAAVLGTNS